MAGLAERYVKLVLAVGVHDTDYIDACYGRPEGRTAAAAERRGLAELDTDAAILFDELRARPPGDEADELERQRHRYLARRVESLRGERLSFDVEAAAPYDAVSPTHVEGEFERELEELAQRLPADGPLARRYEAFRRRFEIPRRSGCRRCSPPRSRDAGRARSSTSSCRPARASRSST